MAENFGANFSIDISQLKAGLSQANRLIRESESEFKAAAAGMDDWTKSQEGLEKRIKTLNEIASLQEKKVSALKSEYEKLIDDGLDPSSAKAADLRIKINNETAALEKSKAEIDKQEAALEALKESEEDAGDGADKMTKQVKDAGDGAEKSSDGFTVMKAVIADLASEIIKNAIGALKDLGAEIANTVTATAEAGDEIDKMSQKLGMTAEGYQEWDYVLGQSGVEITSMSTGLKTMTNQIDDAKNGSEKAVERFKKLGISLADLNSMSREEIFSKVIEGMQGMEDSTERAALANDLFGKSGQELAPLFNSTAEATEALKQEARDLGMVMSDESVKSSAAFEDSLDKLQRTAGGVKASLASQFLPGVTDVMDSLAEILTGEGNIDEAIDGIIEIIEQAAPELTKIITEIGKVAAEVIEKAFPVILQTISDLMPEIIDAIIPIIGEIAEALIDALPQLVKTISTLITKIIKALAKLLPEIVEEIVEIIPEIIDALLDALPELIDAGIELLMGLVDAIPKVIPKLVKELPRIIDKITEVLKKSLPKIIDGAIQLLHGIVDAIPQIIPPIIEALPDIINSIVTLLVENIPVILDGAIQLLMAIIDAIPVIVEALVPQIPTIIDTIINVLLDNIPVLLDAAIQLFMALVEAIPEIALELAKALPEIITTIIESLIEPLGDLFGGLWDSIKEIFAPVGEFFGEAWETIKGAFSSVADTLGGFFSSAWENIKGAFSAVGSFFEGTWTTIKNAFSTVKDWFAGVFAGAWTAIKGAFSKVKEFFTGLWDTIKECFSSIATKIADTFSSAFKSVWNTLIDFVEGAINLLPDAINGAIDAINYLPGVEIDPIEGFDLSAAKLAKGGVVKRATNAIIGEDGAEAVVPLEHNTEWLDKLADKLAAKTGGVVVNQTNNYSQAHSRYEIFKSQQATQAAVKLAIARG